MFQIDGFNVLRDGDVQTGISINFTNGQVVEVMFSDIPSSLGDPAAKAQWLKDRLNELLVAGTNPITGELIRHYKANVVALSDNPFTVGVSVEAV